MSSNQRCPSMNIVQVSGVIGTPPTGTGMTKGPPEDRTIYPDSHSRGSDVSSLASWCSKELSYASYDSHIHAHPDLCALSSSCGGAHGSSSSHSRGRGPDAGHASDAEPAQTHCPAGGSFSCRLNHQFKFLYACYSLYYNTFLVV